MLNQALDDYENIPKKNITSFDVNDFEINLENKPFKPLKKNQFGMYHEKKWYSLNFKTKINTTNILENLDINILNKYCLQSYLNISDVNRFFFLRCYCFFIAGRVIHYTKRVYQIAV